MIWPERAVENNSGQIRYFDDVCFDKLRRLI